MLELREKSSFHHKIINKVDECFKEKFLEYIYIYTGERRGGKVRGTGVGTLN